MLNDLRITMVQTSLIWEDIAGNQLHFDKLLHSLHPGSTDLIILPEMFSTGFTMNAVKLAEPVGGKTFEWMIKKAFEKKCVVTGSVIVEENGLYFNRLYWVSPDGTFSKYDKKHLFRFAKEQEHYTAGTEKLIVNLKGWKIFPLICFDLRFPAWCRNRAGANASPETPELTYDLLLFVANWPERRNLAWKTLLCARAIENQSYVVGVNRVGSDGSSMRHSGDSAVYDPLGERISMTEAGKESVETVTLRGETLSSWRKTFPAWMDGDDVVIR